MGEVRRPFVNLNIGPDQARDCHGHCIKDMFVCHETISPDYAGLADLKGVSEYLDKVGYGIHFIGDAEGKLAVAEGQLDCLFYHTDSSGRYGNGDVNTRAWGYEFISRIPIQFTSNPLRYKAWEQRQLQIHKAARVLAWLNKSHGLKLEYSDGTKSGITTHWQVTTTFGVPDGHVDCWPKHKGGYFPVLELIGRARIYRALGW